VHAYSEGVSLVPTLPMQRCEDVGTFDTRRRQCTVPEFTHVTENSQLSQNTFPEWEETQRTAKQLQTAEQSLCATLPQEYNTKLWSPAICNDEILSPQLQGDESGPHQ